MPAYIAPNLHIWRPFPYPLPGDAVDGRLCSAKDKSDSMARSSYIKLVESQLNNSMQLISGSGTL